MMCQQVIVAEASVVSGDNLRLELRHGMTALLPWRAAAGGVDGSVKAAETLKPCTRPN